MRKNQMKIGVQLYTLRDYCKTLDDFAETLKKVAEIGYTTVQVSGTCEYEGKWLAEALKAAGLTCTLTHYNYDKIINDTEHTIAEHTAFGCDHIGIGGFFDGVEGLQKFVDNTTPAAKKIMEAGKLFMYHNHAWEYENLCPDGKTVMENLSDKFPANLMGFTLDTYWCKYGGYDPLEEIKRLKGRLPRVHFKDMFRDGDNTRMAWVGEGNVLNFEKIAEAFIDAGAEYAYVEQDCCNGMDPMDCVKKSYEYLRSIGLD